MSKPDRTKVEILNMASFIDQNLRYCDTAPHMHPREVLAAAEQVIEIQRIIAVDLTQTKVYIDENPINFLTLIGLLALDRKKTKSSRDQFHEITTKTRESNSAKLRRFKRNDTDPKQIAKLHVRECWFEWQKKLSRYPKGAAEFARDMLAKHEGVLVSTKTIERWCTEWKSELQK